MKFEDTEKDRQATFRNTSVSKQGRSPTDKLGQRHAYMLALDYEDENLYAPLRGNDGARKFFRERYIKWWRQGRYDQGKNRPTRNMASSQIMCVNFMLPLAGVDGALAALIREIDDDVRSIIPIEHEGRTSPVEFEWIGIPKSLESGRERGEYNTSVDAFVVAETSAGRRAYLMEWKYTEKSSTKDYGAGSEGKTRQRRYSGLYRAQFSSFNHKVPMDELLYGEFYQLMRNRLLADRMVWKEELSVSDAKVVLVIPDDNKAYMKPAYLESRFPDMGTMVSEVFRTTLKDPDKAFATVSPSQLLDAVERECGDAVSDWAGYLHERYGP